MPSSDYIFNAMAEDIVDRPPSWILRSGIGMIALVVFVVLLLSSFIRYPDKIVGIGTLTASSPPIAVVANQTGYIDSVFVSDHQEVDEHEPIYYIKNAAAYKQVAEVHSWTDSMMNTSSDQQWLYMEPLQQAELGIIQPAYSTVLLAYNEWASFIVENITDLKIKSFSQEVEKLQELNQLIRIEAKNSKKELDLQAIDLERNQKLLQEQVISDSDFEKAEMAFLQKSRQHDKIVSSIVQNEIRITQLSQQKLQLKEERQTRLRQLKMSLKEALLALATSIEEWKEKYIMIAPRQGYVSQVGDVYKNDIVKEGETLSFVMPYEQNRLLMSVLIPIQNIGKVEIEQEAIIKMDAFPYKEYGVVEAKLTALQSLPQQNEEGALFYEASINLQDPIMTTTADTIPYRPRMTASVEIITENKTIIQRIFKQILSLISTQ
ncbi:MAG: HlyD family secretion protein [Candidatus Cyclobacteriaceae bacterium M2_1C_046]